MKPVIIIAIAFVLLISFSIQSIYGLEEFVDPNLDPQYYVDRYNNEITYKTWFDKNYPHITIFEAVGLSETETVKYQTDLENKKQWDQLCQEKYENDLYVIGEDIDGKLFDNLESCKEAVVEPVAPLTDQQKNEECREFYEKIRQQNIRYFELNPNEESKQNTLQNIQRNLDECLSLQGEEPDPGNSEPVISVKSYSIDCSKEEKTYNDQREAYLRADWQGKALLEHTMTVLFDEVNECRNQLEKESTQETKIVCGTGTIEKNGQCVPDYPDTEPSSKGGGCLIATATYGSELAPEVQKLREIRDNSLLSTESGTNFMNSFNDFYYSFSPVIADYERENPVFREIVKIVITPMIASLSILNYVDMDSEVEVLGYGISLIVMNFGMYVAIPVLSVVLIRKIQ